MQLLFKKCLYLGFCFSLLIADSSYNTIETYSQLIYNRYSFLNLYQESKEVIALKENQSFSIDVMLDQGVFFNFMGVGDKNVLDFAIEVFDPESQEKMKLTSEKEITEYFYDRIDDKFPIPTNPEGKYIWFEPPETYLYRVTFSLTKLKPGAHQGKISILFAYEIDDFY